MIRHRLVSALLLSAMVGVFAQSIDASEWTDYLSGDAAERAGEAVASGETYLRSWHIAKQSNTQRLRDLHIQARRENWSHDEYQTRLDASAAGSSAVSDEEVALAGLRDVLRTLGEVLLAHPPGSGSSAARDADAWLGDMANTLGVENGPVAGLLGDIQLAGQNADSGAALAFVSSLELQIPDGFEHASAQDKVTAVAEHWWLLFLCAPNGNARTTMLSDLAQAARQLSPDLGTQSGRLAAASRVSTSQVSQLHEAASAAVAALTATTMVALTETVATTGETSTNSRANSASVADTTSPADSNSGTDSVDLAQARVLSRLLLRLRLSTRDEIRRAAITSSVTRFVVDTAGALLASLSDRQAFELELRVDSGAGDVRSVAAMLHRVRLDLAEPAYLAALDRARSAAEEYRRTDEYRDQSDLLRGYRQDGEDHLSGIIPWVSGGRTRTGDSYRWAMLSVMSNRYAQYILLGNPELSDAQRLVGGFARDLYDRMFQRLPAGVEERLIRGASGDDLGSFDRSYTLIPGEGVDEPDPQPVYAAFVTESQGAGDESSQLIAASGTVSALSGDWAHTHGLQVAIAGGLHEELPIAAVVLPWFELANRSQVEMQAFGHAIRGMLVLASATDARIAPLLRASGNPAPRFYDPELAVARELLAATTTFVSSPGEMLAVLYGLFGVPGKLDLLVAELEDSVNRVTARLADVEVADRRLIGRAGGGSP